MEKQASLVPLGTSQSFAILGELLQDGGAYLRAWGVLQREAVGGGARLGAAELQVLFGKELERLVGPEDAGSEQRVRAALRSTARCLARRGVSLAELLVTVGLAEAAAQTVLGPERTARLAPALRALERARARAYAEVYLAGGEASACDRSLPSVPAGPRPPPAGRYGLVGDSAPMRQVLSWVEAASRGAKNVLITGESGTGKELVARAIHDAAGGDMATFIAVNCAALPRQLVESELFGHSRGAFTGATGDHPGLFRAAQGGTLFLDELTEMTPEAQAVLLRVVEERVIRPVGGVKEIAVDVRVIASTNRDPARAIAEGRLREDLFYRLQSFQLHLPPLRDRPADIPSLVDHFLAGFCHRRCGCIWGVDADALAALCAAPWPGNVRQLRNVVERAVTTGSAGWIGLADLPLEVGGVPGAKVPSAPPGTVGGPTLAAAEAQLVRAVLQRVGGNKVQAAKALGISRHKLYDLLRRSGVS